MTANLDVFFPSPCDENWENMRPAGCARHCSRCDRNIHDLSGMTIEEVAILLDLESSPCVRAELDQSGNIKLQEAAKNPQKLMFVLATSATLLAAGCQTLDPSAISEGKIAGTIEDYCWGGLVTAVGADGRRYTAEVRSNGKYVIRHLPFGTYDLEYNNGSNDTASAGKVSVSAPLIRTSPIQPENMCIIVGKMMRIEKEAQG